MHPNEQTPDTRRETPDLKAPTQARPEPRSVGNDRDADGQPAPDSTNGGSTGGYGQGLGGGVDMGLIEPGRTGGGGQVDR